MITNLADIVSGQHRWLRYERPFPHVVATDVFHPLVYKAMEEEFTGWLARGLSDRPMATDTTFSRAMGSYDAYGYNFSQDQAGAFDVLLSSSWCRLLADLFDVKVTHHVNLGLHHHLPGSQSGWPHNDLAPGWFADESPHPDHFTLSDHRVNYHTGRGAHDCPNGVVEEVRAVAALIYLANEEWHPGDGGETALFAGAGGDPTRPAGIVAPINNSMLVFECTPFSFHTFLSNRRIARNGLVMWLHRPKAEVVRRWDDSSIVYWTKEGA
jgi:hypothetical protein